MAEIYDSMMNPQLEDLIEKLGSKFSLCTVASSRAREINAYFGQLGGGLGTMVPPQVNSTAHKPLSIAFEEISAEKIIPVRPEEVDEVAAESAEADEQQESASE